jgi:NAD(P)-dependent dehydrogenase (short-subunit alcohol dehydrogenase family)
MTIGIVADRVASGIGKATAALLSAVSSTDGTVALPGSGSYIATKHSVVGLTRAAAADYRVDGLRVNAVCPDSVSTPLARENLKERSAALHAKTPMGRPAEPAEIAETIVWLGAGRSSYATGAVLMV